MRIWLINHYASTMFLDKGGRHYSLAKYLKRMGHEPVVICCNALHEKPETIKKTNELWFSEKDEEIDVPFVFIAGRTYVGNGKGRALNILDFYRNLLKSYKAISKKYDNPDIVVGSSIHPLAPILAIKIANRLKSKSICEFRDLWPDELICMGAMKENSIPAIVLRIIEHWSYKKADVLVFTMEGATEYIKNRKWDTDSGGDVDLSKAIYINNGVDLEDFHKNLNQYTIKDEDLDNPNIFKVTYTGMIRKANGIDKILLIAKELIGYPDIKFLLYGAGNEVEEVKKRISDEKLTNVVYKGNLNKKYIPYVLSKSNLNLLNYMNGDLFRYGCSNNKLFEYMASGKPILCTIKMNYSIINRYGCGFEVDENATVKDVAHYIKSIYEDPIRVENYQEKALNAIKDFDYAHHAQLLDSVIKKVSNNHSV